jgi:hypothetical protein
LRTGSEDKMKGVLCIAGLLTALALPTAAVAGGIHFHSPSGNISCYTWKARVAISCEDLSTGANADLMSNGFARRGTGVRGYSGWSLSYGRSYRVGYGLTCYSVRSGISCSNRDGHGFGISRGQLNTW